MDRCRCSLSRSSLCSGFHTLRSARSVAMLEVDLAEDRLADVVRPLAEQGPRELDVQHGHGAKKVLAGVRFQWMLLLLLLPPVHTGTPVLGQQGPTVHGVSTLGESHISCTRWQVAGNQGRTTTPSLVCCVLDRRRRLHLLPLARGS